MYVGEKGPSRNGDAREIKWPSRKSDGIACV